MIVILALKIVAKIITAFTVILVPTINAMPLIDVQQGLEMEVTEEEENIYVRDIAMDQAVVIMPKIA